MLGGIKKLMVVGLIALGGWVWGHWLSLVVGLLLGAVMLRWWTAKANPSMGGPVGPRPQYERVEGYGWMRTR